MTGEPLLPSRLSSDPESGTRPWLLDLFCCAGGMAKGFHRAGFNVLGVDIKPQPNYPFDFEQMDAVLFMRAMLREGRVDAWRLKDFAAIHASCPCQAHSDLQKQSKRTYVDFIPVTRAQLQATGLPYVIENVEGAPLINPVRLCGASPEFPDLRVIRHRLFESNVPLVGTACPVRHPLVFTHDKRKAHYGRLDQDTAYVQVTGGGNCTVANKADAMGIDWMTGKELNEAIPPAFGEYIGRQLMAAVESGTATERLAA